MIPLLPRPSRALALCGVSIFVIAACGPTGETDAHADTGAVEVAQGSNGAATKQRVQTPMPTSRPRGPKAPDFNLTLLDGTAVKLSDYLGQVVIVDFWATWCGPCRMTIPHLVEMQNEMAENGFTVLGVSMDRGPGKVNQYVETAGINYPVGIGNTGIARAYGGVPTIPMAFVIDRDGYVAKVIRGYQPKAAMEGVIKPLLAEAGTEG